MFTRLSQQASPVSDRIGTIAVNLEPGDRFGQHRPVHQRTLGARRGLRVEQARLQREDLLQAFDIPPRDRQHSQLNSAFERIG